MKTMGWILVIASFAGWILAPHDRLVAVAAVLGTCLGMVMMKAPDSVK